MRTLTLHPILTLLRSCATALAVVSCSPAEKPLTHEEAQEAVDESVWSTKSSALTAEVTEISTHFTIGKAVQAAATDLRDFVKSQIPCAIVTLQDHTVTMDFGAAGGTCTYNGHVWSGKASVTVQKNDATTVQVDHAWDKLSNGVITIDGTANVTWDSAVGTRRIVHSATVTEGARTATGTGDRTQKLIDATKGWAGGIQIDGKRAWTTAKGKWDLAIEGIQVRGVDPVPQAGTYRLTTPSSKVLSMAFARLSPTQIQVTVVNGGNVHKVNVTSLQ